MKKSDGRNMRTNKLALVLLAIAPGVWAEDRKIAPTWLHRYVPEIHEQKTDLTTSSCHYLPIFGEGDPQPGAVQSVSRFGELTVYAHGACAPIDYPRQEELYFILNGSGALRYGEKTYPLRPNDFMYLAPTVRHNLSNPSGQPFRVVVITFKIPGDVPINPPLAEPAVANLDDLREQTVEGHPTSVLYKLLIGPRTGTRDRINTAYVVADLFFMDFAPRGTNFPHHHEVAEEIYLMLEGEGQMVAGGGRTAWKDCTRRKRRTPTISALTARLASTIEALETSKLISWQFGALVPLPKNPD
jgi:mannose-6-phosphate isomerase-like protein (cupin superfamily)